MGWASGFRAGSELARTAMDTYYDVKKKTEMGYLERDLQRQQEERQAELDAYNANVAVAQQQPQATQVGIGQQFNPQQSLVMPQQQVPQLRGVNQVAPGQMSPVGGQALGLGVAPTEMSDASIERMRAQRLRGLGYTEEADKALGRASLLREEDRTARLDAENTRRWEADFEYKRGRDKVADEQFDENASLARDQLSSLDRLRQSMIENTENQIKLRNLGVQQEQIPIMAQQAYTDSVLSGRNIMDVAGNPPEGFAEDPALSALWATTVMGKFREETGLNDGQLATLYGVVDNELNSIISSPYDNDAEQAKAFNSFIGKYVPDTNAADSFTPQIQEDPDNPGMYTLVNGPINLNEQYMGSPEPRSLSEIGAAFQTKLKESPSTYVLAYVDAKQKSLLQQAAAKEEEEAAREFLIAAYKENPGLFGDKQDVDSLLAAAGFAAGYDASAYASGGAGGLKDVAPDAVEKPSSTTDTVDRNSAPYKVGQFVRRRYINPYLSVYGAIGSGARQVGLGLTDAYRGVISDEEGR